MRVGVCVKWVDPRPEIDPLSGEVHVDARRAGCSPADQAALELGLMTAERLGLEVTLASVGPPVIEPVLLDLAARGVQRVVRVVSDDVATGLAVALDGCELVFCGDHSLDDGTGVVPATLAHHLGAAQGLGVIAVHPVEEDGSVRVERRLGDGGTEVRLLRPPWVVSVEGSVARLRRAALAAVASAGARPIEELHIAGFWHTAPVVARGPLRPRTRRVPAPQGSDPRARLVELTGALVDRTPPRTVTLPPAEAAEVILEQLRSWGYLDASG
jgi:electron transfer flavoprotein beta subunit